VLAAGHRAVRGGGTGSEDVEVVLERGWAELLLFEDALGDTSGNPTSAACARCCPGVEVFADGVRAGVSDADGIVLDRGRGAARGARFPLGRMARRPRGELGNPHQVWMVRDP
jgi:hypothetical protein